MENNPQELDRFAKITIIISSILIIVVIIFLLMVVNARKNRRTMFSNEEPLDLEKVQKLREKNEKEIQESFKNFGEVSDEVMNSNKQE